MKKLITLLILGVGLVAHAEIKRGTIVGAYRLAQPTSQGFNTLIEAVENPRYSNQRLFYMAEVQGDKIVRKGAEYVTQIAFERGGKKAALLNDFGAATVAAELDVSRTGTGTLAGRLDGEEINTQVSYARNCKNILSKNNQR